MPKHGRGFRYTPTLSSVERSASVQIAATAYGAQDAVDLSRGDFGYVGFAKRKVRGFDNEDRWVPALTTSARKQNVGVSAGPAVMLSERRCNASILQLHYAGSGKAVAVRGAVDLDRVFKGVSSVSAEVCVETVIAETGPAEFGPVPIVVREVFGPASAGQSNGDMLARRSPFLGQTQRVPAKPELGEDHGAIAQLRNAGTFDAGPIKVRHEVGLFPGPTPIRCPSQEVAK